MTNLFTWTKEEMVQELMNGTVYGILEGNMHIEDAFDSCYSYLKDMNEEDGFNITKEEAFTTKFIEACFTEVEKFMNENL